MRSILLRCTDRPESAVLLLLRLVMGAAFILHGWPKIQHATTWMSANGPAPVPPAMQALAAYSEFVGGILLLLGLLNALGAIAIMCVMIGALVLVHFPKHHPFVSPDGPSFELSLVYLVAAMLLVITGP